MFSGRWETCPAHSQADCSHLVRRFLEVWDMAGVLPPRSRWCINPPAVPSHDACRLAPGVCWASGAAHPRNAAGFDSASLLILPRRIRGSSHFDIHSGFVGRRLRRLAKICPFAAANATRGCKSSAKHPMGAAAAVHKAEELETGLNLDGYRSPRAEWNRRRPANTNALSQLEDCLHKPVTRSRGHRPSSVERRGTRLRLQGTRPKRITAREDRRSSDR